MGWGVDAGCGEEAGATRQQHRLCSWGISPVLCTVWAPDAGCGEGAGAECQQHRVCHWGGRVSAAACFLTRLTECVGAAQVQLGRV